MLEMETGGKWELISRLNSGIKISLMIHIHTQLQSFLCPKLAVPSFRRIDKISLRTSPLSRLIVTDSWVVVVGSYPWSFQLSHQSDVTLKIIDSEQHRISTEGHIGGAQYLHISINNR